MGESLGRYRVERLLGAGTFATVHLGWDEALDVAVAIKILGENWAFDPETRGRFISEAQLLRRVDGTRVVRVHDIGQAPSGQPYFVMDYCDRGTLEERLAGAAGTGAVVTAEDAREVVRLLAAGMAEVHRLGVAHRDLKPSNLLLTSTHRQGEPDPARPYSVVAADERLLISDLGLARDLMGPTRLTAVVGTPGYMAPEQRDPSFRVDGRADIYAATAILHRIVSGVAPPAEGWSPEQWPAGQVPDTLHELFRRGLCADPAGRVATAEEWGLLAELALVDAGAWEAPVPSTPAVASWSSLRWVGGTPSRPPIPAALRGAGASPASAVGSFPGSIPPAGAAPTDRNRRVLWIGLAALVVVALTAATAIVISRRGDEPAPTPPPGGTAALTAVTVPLAGFRLLDPLDVLRLDDGRLLVADSSANRVLAIDEAAGTVGVFAGSGRLEATGDGGPATAAGIALPAAVARGGAGSVLVVDGYDGQVRRVSAAGIISTVAGNAKSGTPRAGAAAVDSPLRPLDVAEAPDGTVYVADGTDATVWSIGSDGRLSAFATNDDRGTPFGRPSSIAITPSGHVVVGDVTTGRVIEIDPAAPSTPVLVADGLSPQALAVGEDGAVLVSDATSARVLRFGTPGASPEVVVGGGTVDGDGKIAVADGRLVSPAGLDVGPGGAVFLVDTGADRLRRIADGELSTIAGSGDPSQRGDGGPAFDAPVHDPRAVLEAKNGNLLVAEGTIGQIRGIDAEGIISTVAGNGGAEFTDGASSSDGYFNGASALARTTDQLLVGELITGTLWGIDRNAVVHRVAGNGSAGDSGDGGPATAAQLGSVGGLAVAADGAIWISDMLNNRIRRITPDGIINTAVGNGLPSVGKDGPASSTPLTSPTGLAFRSDGTLVFAELLGHRVRELRPDGTVHTIAGTGDAGFGGDGGPAIDARLSAPSGVAVGTDGSVYVAERDGNRVRRIDAAGTITTVVGDGQVATGALPLGPPLEEPAAEVHLSAPQALLVTTAGDLVVADTGGSRILRIRDGRAKRIAGL